jgi:hypothetical protein
MKHFRLDGSFEYSEEPFPAFRSRLVYGRNKRDFEFLPTKVQPDEEGILPEGQFRLIETREKKTLLVVPGTDTTNRALVFVGASEGFRGSCGLRDDTTAKILKKCYAGNATSGRVEVIALMEVGQRLIFYSTGRRNNDVIVHEFNGQEIESTTYTKDEYQVLEDEPEDYEIL